MKKTIAVLFVLFSAVVFAGKDDLLITFSTPGPDKYADGKDVLEGESYALVWTGADGTQKTVITYPGATKVKDGDGFRCPPVLFVIDENKVANYDGGTWGVYLLDTRDYETDPEGKTLAKREDGQPTVINVKAAVADGIANSSTMSTAAASGAVSAGAFDIPTPTVTAIKVEGAYVCVTVKDVVPCLEYTLKSGSNTQDFVIPEGVEKDASSTVKEITLTVPKKEGVQFFKVTTK